MGFLRDRIFPAIGVFFGTLMIGGYQGQLFHSISHNGVDSPESRQLMVKIASTAWGMAVVSVFYQSLGFSQQDLEIMYCAAVKAGPNIVFEGKNLFATFFLIHKHQEFGYKLYAIAQSVKDKTGIEREQELIRQINTQVQECLAAIDS